MGAEELVTSWSGGIGHTRRGEGRTGRGRCDVRRVCGHTCSSTPLKFSKLHKSVGVSAVLPRQPQSAGSRTLYTMRCRLTADLPSNSLLTTTISTCRPSPCAWPWCVEASSQLGGMLHAHGHTQMHTTRPSPARTCMSSTCTISAFSAAWILPFIDSISALPMLLSMLHGERARRGAGEW